MLVQVEQTVACCAKCPKAAEIVEKAVWYDEQMSLYGNARENQREEEGAIV